MKDNALKEIFTFTSEEREKLVVVFVSLILFIICIITSQWIMPEHCNLFSDNIEGRFACDGWDSSNPRPCPVCYNRQLAAVASIIASLGIAFLFLPFIVFVIRNLRNRPVRQTKLFD